MDGINVKAIQQTSLRSNIGVVAQETILFHSSLRENSACDDLPFVARFFSSGYSSQLAKLFTARRMRAARRSTRLYA